MFREYVVRKKECYVSANNCNKTAEELRLCNGGNMNY